VNCRSAAAGGTNPAVWPLTYRRTMWRVSSAQALKFIATIVICAVAVGSCYPWFQLPIDVDYLATSLAQLIEAAR